MQFGYYICRKPGKKSDQKFIIRTKSPFIQSTEIEGKVIKIAQLICIIR